MHPAATTLSPILHHGATVLSPHGHPMSSPGPTGLRPHSPYKQDAPLVAHCMAQRSSFPSGVGMQERLSGVTAHPLNPQTERVGFWDLQEAESPPCRPGDVLLRALPHWDLRRPTRNPLGFGCGPKVPRCCAACDPTATAGPQPTLPPSPAAAPCPKCTKRALCSKPRRRPPRCGRNRDGRNATGDGRSAAALRGREELGAVWGCGVQRGFVPPCGAWGANPAALQ